MKNLLDTFVKNFPWLIVGWVCFNMYNDYMRYQEDLNVIKETIPGIHDRIAKAKKKIQVSKDFKADLDESKKRIEEVAEQIEAAQKQLPNKISDPEIMDFISQEAGTLNVKNVYITPAEEEEKGFFISKKYNFKGQGTYLQFLIFFDRLGDSERLFNISNMAIETAKDKQKGRFKLVNLDTHLETFRYNAGFKENRGIQEIESKYGAAAPPAQGEAPPPKRPRPSRNREED